MPRNINTNHFFFFGQFFHGIPLIAWRNNWFGNLHIAGISKQTHLWRVLIFLKFCSKTDGFFIEGQIITIGMKILRPMRVTKTIKTTRQNQIFNGFFVGCALIYTFCQIKNRFVVSFFSIFNNSIYGIHSNTFYRSNTKTNGIIIVYCKFIKWFIHIWTQNLQSHSLAFFHKKGNLFNVAHIIRQNSSHIFGWIIGF